MKHKGHNRSWWNEKEWNAFSRYVRLRDWAKQDDPDPWTASCVSCRKPYTIRGQGCMQAGHFITRKRTAILFDEKNVHAQCYTCNYTLKGNWDQYYETMLKMYGQEAIDDLMARRFDITKRSLQELEDGRDYYKAKLKELTDQYGDPF
jgi:hypothetical protein